MVAKRFLSEVTKIQECYNISEVNDYLKQGYELYKIEKKWVGADRQHRITYIMVKARVDGKFIKKEGMVRLNDD